VHRALELAPESALVLVPVMAPVPVLVLVPVMVLVPAMVLAPVSARRSRQELARLL
jgi:hypothetical protein